MTRVLVTGANGFIGKAIVQRLSNDHVDVIGACRHHENTPGTVLSPSLDLSADWRFILSDRTVVIHAAGRAHFLKERTKDTIELFRQVNAIGTLNLAAQAAEMGVRRFVFLSSIGVNGAETSENYFNEASVAAPHSPYAFSKYEAEIGLMEIARKTGLNVVIIRPPLVYGPGAPGNFGSLVRWLLRGVPLPLGAIHNRRSLVALDNLVDLIVTCVDHPAAANQTFLVSDGEDLSTTQLLRRMGLALGKPARLLPGPSALLKLGAALVRRPAVAQRLCGSLQVDISKTRQILGWTPPLSVDEGLKKAAEGYLNEASV